MNAHENKFFRFYGGATFFSKYFGYVKVFYVNFFHYKKFISRHKEWQISFTKSEIITRFQNNLMVFVALTNCFRKRFFIIFLNFNFICYLFSVKWPIVPCQRSSHFSGGANQSRQFFLLLSNVCFDFKYNCFKKYRLIFEPCHYFLSFFSQLRERSQRRQAETDFLCVIN